MQGTENMRSEAYLMYTAATNIEGNAADGCFSTVLKGPLAQLAEQMTLNH
jgi:hypothetical protein